MAAAMAVLRRAETEPVRRDLRKRIDELCEALFRSIALQTSMSRYKASGAERGCILDFVDYPLNSRWWLEDEFKAIGAAAVRAGKAGAARTLADLGAPRRRQLLRRCRQHRQVAACRPGGSQPPGIEDGADADPGGPLVGRGRSRKRPGLDGRDELAFGHALHRPRPEGRLCDPHDGVRDMPALDRRRARAADHRQQGDRRVQGIPGSEGTCWRTARCT